mmetsp:Transcript_22931/g.47842  ORF Transcript_22931/g.47842 Transcript_22931/m.47842 type:complete len:92 (+) Transcript_22931:432-707(+)
MVPQLIGRSQHPSPPRCAFFPPGNKLPTECSSRHVECQIDTRKYFSPVEFRVWIDVQFGSWRLLLLPHVLLNSPQFGSVHIKGGLKRVRRG